MHAIKYYTECEKYYEQYGNLNIPYSYKTTDKTALGVWLERQRYAYHFPKKASNKLSHSRIAQLNSLGIDWEDEDNWEKRYKYAKEFFAKYGHLNISQNYITNNKIWLGQWLGIQKKINRGEIDGKKLSIEQINKLESIGIEWQSHKLKLWDGDYNEAKTYYKQFGNINVSQKYVSESWFHLGSWISKQHISNKNGTLSANNKQKLDALHMVWIVADEWKGMYILAKQYYKTNGHLDIPTTYCTDEKNALKVDWKSA